MQMQSDLRKLSLQFLCGHQLNAHLFPAADLTLEDQKTLLTATVDSDLVLRHPVKIDYQKAFLKYLLYKLEKQGLEVHEDLYSAYGRLVAVPELGSECYKHYPIGVSGTVISLKENVHLISEGTTGLRTWQASLALAEWCIDNKNLLIDKNILELGSGIGLTGLVAALTCQPKQFCFSDCHPSVIRTLCDNVQLNCERLFSEDYLRSTDNSEKGVILHTQLQNGVDLRVLNLPWEDIDCDVCDSLGKIDIVLAADIVYDAELFESLIKALKCISVQCHVQDIVFACTERNQETLDTFLRNIGEYFEVIEKDCPCQKTFVWNAIPPVRIFQFKLL